jgi:peroxiredoxin Q/BCP
VISRALAATLTVTALVAVAAGRMKAQSPKVGDMAPDFTLSGSTKDGVLPKPIHLADFRGQTVVLAFFPKARTKG